MKKKFLNILFVSSLLFAGSSALVISQYRKSEKHEIICEVEAGEGTYYSEISDSLTGDSLKNALHTLNNKKRSRTVGYAGMRTFASKCDIDPDGSGKIIGFYDNAKIGPSWDGGDTWNREHVWPNIRGGSSVEADAHMVRPAATSTNSDRGSKGFGTESFDPGKYVAYYRGAAARIIFYAAIADTDLSIVDYAFNYDGVQNGNSGYPTTAMGKLSDLLRWNLQYLPSDTSFTGANDLARRTELNRNEVIQNNSSGQGNRNPFIDHPEYACKIWGNYNSATQAACSGQPTGGGGSGEGGEGGQGGGSETPTFDNQEVIYYGKGQTINLNKGRTDILINKSFNLIATTTDGSDVTWEFSKDAEKFISYDKSKTTYKSGEALAITAIAKGTVIAYAKNVKTKELVACKLTLTNINRPLVIGVSVGVGSALLIAAIVIVVVVIVKKKHA